MNGRVRSAPRFEAVWLFPALAFAILAAASASFGPDTLLQVLAAGLLLALISVRPQWGVAVIFALLLVQYGTRRFERTGWAGTVLSLLPSGTGLVTPNNVMGVFLGMILVYRIYRDGDWSFLRNPQVRLVALIGGLLAFSALVNRVDYEEFAALGLRFTEQDPVRAMISRVLFLVLFVAFVQRARDLRVMIWLFVVLAVATAWSGGRAGLAGAVDIPQAAEYRAGGLGVLIETAGNPNRLALVATLALIFLWEYSQSGSVWRRRWIFAPPMLLLVVTVFLTASRGGAIGLTAAMLLMFVRRRPSAGRFAYTILVALLGAVLVSQIVPEANLERIGNIPGLSEDTTGEGTGSLERRRYTYGVAFDIWARAPVFGVGLGNWSLTRFTIDPLRSAAVPHNSYLKALAEGGAATLAAYLALFLLTLRQLGELERDPDVMEQARQDGLDWLIGAIRVCILAFLVFSIFADLWELVFFYFLIGVAATLIQFYGSARRPALA
jgi:O-antigen ligase